LLAQPPGWIDALMAARNAIVRPFGLKTGQEAAGQSDAIGIFPIVSLSPHRAVLGFEDKHLDFRVVVDVAEFEGTSQVTATTLVRLNNLLGRAYLAAILPFHRIIVRTLLEQVARR